MRRMVPRRTVLAGLCLAVVWSVLSAFSIDASFSGAAELSATRCPVAPTRDFSAPLRRFPSVRQLPPGGELPFGPPDAALSSLSGSVQAGRGRVGYSLGLNRRPPLKRRLGWQIELRVLKLDWRGNERRLFAERRMSLGVDQEVGVEDIAISAPVPGAPAYFRLDIALRKKSGAILGRFSEYVRVVPATVNVRLLLSANVVKPNEAVLSRAQNRGSVSVAITVGNLRLERRTEAEWKVVPPKAPPSWSGGPLGIGLVPGGALGFCEAVRIPPQAEPGAYRLSERFSANGHSRTVHAPFQVR